MAQAECSKCSIVFTSLGSFDRHLGKLTEDGYQHLKPEDCGLVTHENGKVSLPPPDTKRFWEMVKSA